MRLQPRARLIVFVELVLFGFQLWISDRSVPQKYVGDSPLVLTVVDNIEG